MIDLQEFPVGGRSDATERTSASRAYFFTKARDPAGGAGGGDEILCDAGDRALGGQEYRSCVAGALEVLRDRGLLSRNLADRLLASVLRDPSGSERGDVGR